MPRKNGKKSGRIRGRGRGGNATVSRDPDQRIVTTNFRIYGTHSSSGTAGTLTIGETDLSPPSWGSRGIAFADLYQKYRITHLQISAWARPGVNTTATQTYSAAGNCLFMMAIYYGPKSTFTTPTTKTQFVDFPHLRLCNDGGKPTMSMTLTKRDLISHMNQKWMQTTPTGETDPENIQLCLEMLSDPLFTITGGTASLDYLADITVEFTGSVDPAIIPLRRIERSYVIEKKSQ